MPTFKCNNGEFIKSEFYNISENQVVDMTHLNFYCGQDRVWAKKQSLLENTRLIICSTKCDSDDLVDNRLHREWVWLLAATQMNRGKSFLIAQEGIGDWKDSVRLCDDVY